MCFSVLHVISLRIAHINKEFFDFTQCLHALVYQGLIKVLRDAFT